MSGEVTNLPTKLGAGDALATKETYKDEAWWRWDAMIKGGAVSKSETPATCIAKAAYGELYGWDPILSVNRLYLVDGRPCMAAEAMIGLIRERMPRAVIAKAHHDRRRCVIKAKRDRDDEEWHVCEFNMDDAKHLQNKTNWKNYPKAMLWARCASMLTRELFSDITLGAHTPDEIREAQGVRVRQVGPQAMTFDDAEAPDDAEVIEPEPEPSDSEDEPTGEPADDGWSDTDAIDGPPEDEAGVPF